MPNLMKEDIELLIYENKQMGDFLQCLGLTPNDITSYVINGSLEDIQQILAKIKKDFLVWT